MSDKKKLRGHAVIVKDTPYVSSIKYPSFKNKFIEKENCKLRGNIKENNDETSNKKVESQRHESQYNYKSKRRVAKQSATSKLKLFQKKTSVLSSVENICTKKMLTTNKKNSEVSLKLKTLPIYKRNLHLLNPRKKRRCVDVYDITLEEELVSNVIQVEKKRIHSTKIKQKENSENKKQDLNSNKHLKLKKKKLLNSKSVRKSPLSIDKLSAEKQEPVETDKLFVSQILLSNQNKFNNEVCIEQNPFSVSSLNDTIESIQDTLQSSKPEDKKKMYLSNLAEEFENSFSVPKMTSTPGIHSKTEIQTQKNKNKIINIADISNIPACDRNSIILMSTLNNSHSKSEIQTQRNIVTSIPGTSDILANNKNGENSSLCTAISSDTDVSPQTDKDNEEISLFESPKKSKVKEKNHHKAVSPQKTIQINLFGKVLQTPSSSSSAESLEESVIMPKKAYHTPDNFKKHLIRTKVPNGKTKKETKKSKQDQLIEKLSKHFEEIGNTELCIE